MVPSRAYACDHSQALTTETVHANSNQVTDTLLHKSVSLGEVNGRAHRAKPERTIEEVLAYLDRMEATHSGGCMSPDYCAAVYEIRGFIDGEFD